MRESFFRGTKEDPERCNVVISPTHMLCSVYQGDTLPALYGVQAALYSKRNNRDLYLMSFEREARTKEQRKQRQMILLQLNNVLSVAPVYTSGKDLLVPSGIVEVDIEGKRTDLEKLVGKYHYRIEGGKEGSYLVGSLEPAPKISPLGIASALWQYDSIVKAQPVFLRRKHVR